ncbi:leucyl/phenylalanyl-tRNA--protein transferase [Aurantibacter aestuarii]|uniref:Leucyl/phenylalanyl-tRNA--protein transferase n=1 Tax=Aurantibacter aestuarii TaxID=1266046 RepID=A0A2T1NCE4_9FLAO|nr:leucyl/phenylalanyl-tRNA--protein transferase [Aurantibacter aestuarii]PSG90113.1 leucyl/phenylalanyl-tRNA--protein transferase [Aurantibacter aestuarii]
MIYLRPEDDFPELSQATKDGLLAIGGNLTSSRLISAYQKGIFPWFEDDEQLLWWSPDPRFVLFPEELKVSKSMKQFLKNCNLEVTINKDFNAVITACSKINRPGQEGTWITIGMIKAYTELHELGFATSVEVWQEDSLVAGLYGVDLNNGVFCGESMFSTISNGSKAGFITFIQNTNYKLIDCQVYTNHLESLGARDISREAFLKFLIKD